MNCEPGRCPLCDRTNECQLARTESYKGPCWCAKENVPAEMLASVPEDARNVACVCRRCIIAANFAAAKKRPAPLAGPGDFYLEGQSIVFTASYHRRRGYCCGSGCRHCPYDSLEREIARQP